MNTQQCLAVMVGLKSGCQSEAEFWAAVAELRQSGAELQQSAPASDSEGSAAGGAAEAPKKRRGPKPLAERTPEQQAAHAAKQAQKAAEKQASAASSDAEAPKKRAPKASGGAAAAGPSKQNAWLVLVADTVKHMSAHGWTPWSDGKGTLWAGSMQNAEGEHVYAAGPHAGKGPSNQRGGMARASYVRANAEGVQALPGLQGEWAELEKA
jgi:hypothetical protein